MSSTQQMKKLSKNQTIIFLFGAIMMVVGAFCNVLSVTSLFAGVLDPDTGRKVGACIFTIGSLCFASMQIMQSYEGSDFVIRRLRRMQIIGDLLFILSAAFMMENAFGFFCPAESDSMDYKLFYLQYINNNWVVVLLIAAILEVYTTHRIANVIKKT